jgi:hypothetical protein
VTPSSLSPLVFLLSAAARSLSDVIDCPRLLQQLTREEVLLKIGRRNETARLPINGVQCPLCQRGVQRDCQRLPIAGGGRPPQLAVTTSRRHNLESEPHEYRGNLTSRKLFRPQ